MKNFRFSSSLFLTGFFCIALPFSARAELTVGLEIRNDHDFSYSQVPVTAGIPVPRDRDIRSTGMLNIETAEGETVPSQFQVTARWGGTPDEIDKPVKWLLATFFADVGARGSATYYLTGEKENQTSAGVTIVSNTTEKLLINTLAAEFTVSKQHFSLLKRVTVGGMVITDTDENGLILQDGSGTEYASFHGPPQTVALIEEGPLRAVVKVTGTLQNTDNGDSLDCTAYLYFYAGKSFVRVLCTLGNHRPLAFNETAGKYEAFDYYGANSVTFASVEAAIRLDQAPTGLSCTYPSESGRATVDLSGDFLAYQDSSGTDYWDNYGSSDQPRTNAYCRFRGYQVTLGEGRIGAGDHFAGWMDLSGAEKGITAGIRNFWQLFPKALASDAQGGVFLKLFPPEYTGQYNFRTGEEKTHEFFLYFPPGNASSSGAGDIAQCLNAPLTAVPSPR